MLVRQHVRRRHGTKEAQGRFKGMQRGGHLAVDVASRLLFDLFPIFSPLLVGSPFCARASGQTYYDSGAAVRARCARLVAQRSLHADAAIDTGVGVACHEYHGPVRTTGYNGMPHAAPGRAPAGAASVGRHASCERKFWDLPRY
jgi:hypothetical protein